MATRAGATSLTQSSCLATLPLLRTSSVHSRLSLMNSEQAAGYQLESPPLGALLVLMLRLAVQ